MRLKIIAGNFAVVVLLGLFAFFAVRGELRTGLVKDIDVNITNEQELLDRSFRLAAINSMSSVSERAASRQVRDVFAGLDDNSRRTRAFETAEAVFAWMGDPARGRRGVPDIVVIVDETGTALARNGARNVMFGKKLIPSVPALAEVLKDGAVKQDVWLEENEKKVLQTAMAPIRSDSGMILGALIVGYDLSNAVAAAESKVLGREVAFVVKDRVYSSSLEGGLARTLAGYLFGENKTSTTAVLSDQSPRSRPWMTTLAGDEYVGITVRMPMSESLPVAYAVLGNRTAEMALASAANIIIYVFVLGAVLVLVYGFVIGTAIMRPIEQIEEGVLAVINGRTDLRLDTDSPELGGLAYRINQLLNVFTGTEEDNEDAEGRVSVAAGQASAWKDAEFSDSAPEVASAPAAQVPAGGAGGDEPIDDPAIATKLGAEDEQAYNTRIYNEYVAAKQSLGENVSNITMDRFTQRLKGRADAMAKQHGCRMVRFQVQARDKQVALRPVIIR